MRRTARHTSPFRVDRRGISFCYAMIVLTAMLTLGTVFLSIGLNSAKWAYGHCSDQRAFYLAEAATDRAIWMMQSSASGDSGINDALAVSDADAAAGVTRTYQSPTWQLADGTYRFTATAPYKEIPGTIAIQASGTTRGTNTERIAKVVQAVPSSASGSTIPSPCFGYGLFSDHNFTMTGNATVKGHTELGGSGVYANGNVTFTGNPTVYGPVSATGTIAVTGNFNQIPANAGRNAHSPRVAMPVLDLAKYQAMADETWGSGGTVTKTGNIDAPLGTVANPKIIYVNGTLKLTGNVRLTGVGLIVASNGITITGNVTYGSPDNTSWGFLTGGAMTITGNAQVYGSIYCHNAAGDAYFTATGNANVHGAVVADVVTLTGNYLVEWDAGPSQIADLPGATRPSGPPTVNTVFWQRS